MALTYICTGHVFCLGVRFWPEPILDVYRRYVKGVSLGTYFQELHKCAHEPGRRCKILGAVKECCKQILKVGIINYLILL